ncbi:twin-arginine translocation signal domain-containing protein [Halopiger djelfimassiliensis]|uniref:twin-arginine translocation signal domain-containing protein n=1 Tax=Halopiger djelfimassiliensis TaxID=1293047 RepID=UPI0012B59DFE|nr:twin-arginine translocation signal domain-containing protein [Halopiger djelfimassiliensis]
MSHQTRRSFLSKSAATTVGIGALATGSGMAASEVQDASDEATAHQSWPVTSDYTDLAPGSYHNVDSPAISFGTSYECELDYSPEVEVEIGVYDAGSDSYYVKTVSGPGNYTATAPTSIAESDAYVTVGNLSGNSSSISGSLTVSPL